ncbi:MAG TPA: NAD(P)/FAD-dependent oxidoreductase [Longimicrobiales bacterium]|nr:NAD(P)/FAD-dependent oxidoreductase [Longimicrobiales bacterium]
MAAQLVDRRRDPSARRPRVVIIGGGFAGLYCARSLARAPVDVMLIDRRNHHVFQPLLYQVATASLSPADVAVPIRSILRRQENVEVWMGEAVDVDPDARIVRLRDGTLEYDYLVLATGATHAYFGHDEWEAIAPGLKTLDDATEIRKRFLLAFEAAEREADPETRRRLLTFVIIGAGPTGVELAGAMAEIAREVMPQDFRAIDTTTTRILLLEGGPRVLPAYPPDLSEKAQRQLERLGVEVQTNALVTRLEPGTVYLGDRTIAAGNVFWAAGVAASSLGTRLGAEVDRAGRVKVEPDCSIPGHPEVFVVGDLAALEENGKPVPGVAPAAMQMGRYVGRTIRRDLGGKPRKRFHYRDKGNLATIGRAAAVADFGRLRFSGLPAWLLWVFVHILYLIGFRNRLIVMMQWAWAWVTYQRGIRLITGEATLDLERAREPGPPAEQVRRGPPPGSFGPGRVPMAARPASPPPPPPG